VWGQRAGGTGDDGISALAISGASVYVVGSFESSTAAFGSITLTNSPFSNRSDVFVAKLADAGLTAGFVWAQSAGSTERDYAGALAVSGTSVYVAGAFEGPTATFGSITLTNSSGNIAPSPGPTSYSTDVFVAKLTDTGPTAGFVWVQQAGGVGGDYAAGLAVSGMNVYMTGYFRSLSATFGPVILAGASAGGDDAFVARLTDGGPTAAFTWAQCAGGTNFELASSLAVNGTTLYVGGLYNSPTVSFGSTTLTQPTPGFPSAYIGFLASLTDATPTAIAAPIKSCALAAYPNPATGRVQLVLPPGAVRADVLDARGRVMSAVLAPTGNAVLDVAGLPPGVYAVRAAGQVVRLLVE
jgi:hypothetical protein